MYLRLNTGQQIFICSANMYQMPSVCLVACSEHARCGPSPGEILSLEEKGSLGVCVRQKGDKLPENRVVRTTARGHQSTMGAREREPLVCLQEGEKH